MCSVKLSKKHGGGIGLYLCPFVSVMPYLIPQLETDNSHFLAVLVGELSSLPEAVIAL